MADTTTTGPSAAAGTSGRAPEHLDRARVAHLAGLARIALTDDEMDTAVLALFNLRDRAVLPWTDPRKHGAGYQRIAAFTSGSQGGPQACTPPNLHPPNSPTPTPTRSRSASE